MKKKLPNLPTDKAAEAFVETADLTEYDLSPLRATRFEFSAKEARVNMRMPEALLAEVKAAAHKAGMPYQRYIRLAIETAIRH